MSRRRWEEWEDTYIIEHTRTRGSGVTDVARHLGRSVTAVYKRRAELKQSRMTVPNLNAPVTTWTENMLAVIQDPTLTHDDAARRLAISATTVQRKRSDLGMSLSTGIRSHHARSPRPLPAPRLHPRHPLTETHLELILNASADESTVALAKRIAANPNTVGQARRRMPWSVPIAYIPCRWCGDLVTMTPSSVHGCRRFYHPACRGEQLRAWARDAQRQRFAAKSREEQARDLARLVEVSAEHAHRHYEDSQKTATNHHLPWDDDEDRYVIEHHGHQAVLAMAQALHRTTYAVNKRIRVLRKRGLID